MSDGTFWPWLALLLLGVWHGINPGMGWLFAVALGLQARSRHAVWHALLPLALGHGLAIGVAIALAALAGLVVPAGLLKWLVAATLLALGLYRLVRSRHPRYGGMQVGMRDLAIWSFLMASAHGAGLMVVPLVLAIGGGASEVDGGAVLAPPGAPHTSAASSAALEHTGHGTHVTMLLSALPDGQMLGLAATLAHTVGYLVIMGLAAVIVYEKLGLRLLRTMWINLDLIWAGALILTAVLTPLV